MKKPAFKSRRLPLVMCSSDMLPEEEEDQDEEEE
jgi:hypothetical protein